MASGTAEDELVGELGGRSSFSYFTNYEKNVSFLFSSLFICRHFFTTCFHLVDAIVQLKFCSHSVINIRGSLIFNFMKFFSHFTQKWLRSSYAITATLLKPLIHGRVKVGWCSPMHFSVFSNPFVQITLSLNQTDFILLLYFVCGWVTNTVKCPQVMHQFAHCLISVECQLST